jgi:acyl phosphate:glycerol-3-phosphate acyltransferase
MFDSLANLNFSWSLYLCAIAAYLIGSIPFGIVLTKLFRVGDLKAIGSGNIGATNVLRTGRKDLALATLILDAGKGAFATYIAGFYGIDMMIVAAIASVVGHIFPVWLRFKGGKGVATTLGVVLVLNPTIGFLTCLIWLFTAIIFRYSSAASLTASVAAPLLAWEFSTFHIMDALIVIAVLVWTRHIGNIIRLVKGTENKIGKKYGGHPSKK